MKKTYLDFVNEIFGSKEATLKELFSTLFLEIHKSFPQDVQIYDIQLIEELKTTWADQQDFNQTLRRFTWKHYSDDRIATILNKNSKFRFSILDLRPIFDRREMKSSQSFSRIKDAYEKGYKIISFEEYATIAEHLIFWRNKAAHRGGIRNVSQALAIYSEISLLIKIYPDNLKSKIFGLDDYQAFLEKDFLESVMLSADFDFQSEPSSPIELPKTENTLDEGIIANLELETLKDSVDDLAKLNHENSNMFDYFKKTLIQIGQAINQTNHFLSEQTALKEPLPIEPINSKIIEEQEDQDEPEAQSLYKETANLEIVDELIESVNEEPDDNEQSDYSTHLTSDEILDNLLIIRDEINNSMRQKHSSFRNWHNICQRPLAEVLITAKPKDITDFKEHHLFQHYYNSEQTPKRVKANLSDEDNKALEDEAKEFMDMQLEDYWNKIQSLLYAENNLLSEYDLRRVYLYVGLIVFPSKLPQEDFEKAKLMIASQFNKRLPDWEEKKSNPLALIFLCGLNEALTRGEDIAKREILQKISNFAEEGYQEESLYSQFFELIKVSVNKKTHEISNVTNGSLNFNPRVALEKLFDFTHEDFIDVYFGDHGWEATPQLSPRKKDILTITNEFRNLIFNEVLKRADEDYKYDYPPSIF